MLRFQHIQYLFALGIIPVLLLVFIWMFYWRKRKITQLGSERIIGEQFIGNIAGRSVLKFILASLAFAALVIGWANLQMGAKTEKVQRKGVDVVVALDVSKSMLAQDIKPDRLTRAKQLVLRMMEKMKNDRVALVVFAGRAYLQVPLTIDYGAMKMMLQNVKPSLVPTQGTIISEAIELAQQSFSQKEKKYKSLVIISDGEDHDENAKSKAKEAAESGIIIHTVGIGSPQGTTLYDPTTKSVKLDDDGNPIISKLNEEELKSIASAGRGSYSLLQNTDDVADNLIDELNGMEQKNLGAVVFTDYASYFQYFLLAGLLFIVVEWLLPSAKMKLKSS